MTTHKLVVLFTYALLFITTESFAQLKFGALGGLNLANMILENAEIEGEESPTPKSITAFHVGGIVVYDLSEKISIQSGLLISGKGTQVEASMPLTSTITLNINSTISPLYIEVPINGIYKLDVGSVKLHLIAGPYVGVGVSGKIKQKITATGLPFGVTLSDLLGGEDDEREENIKFGTEDDSHFKKTDFGINIGAGVEIKNFLIRGQYGLSISNSAPSDETLKFKVIGISVGYMFGRQ